MKQGDEMGRKNGWGSCSFRFLTVLESVGCSRRRKKLRYRTNVHVEACSIESLCSPLRSDSPNKITKYLTGMMILYLREKKRKEILSNIVEPLSVQLNLSNINTRGYIYIYI